MRTTPFALAIFLHFAAGATGFALAPQNPTVGGVTYTNNDATAIDDNGTTSTTITVSGALTSVLDVSLQTFITHTSCADLDITLTSPGGTIVTITTDNGGTNDDVFDGTRWDDDVQSPVTDAEYEDGVTETPLVPEEAFAAFRGEDPNGAWTLTIVDDNGNGSTGSFTWSLNVAALAAAPQSNVATVSTSTPVPLPDLSTTVVTLDVTGADPFLFDLDLVTAITHTSTANLDITLRSPSGTVVVVTTDNGGGNNDVFNGTTWDDDGDLPATDATYQNNTVQPLLVPEGAFGAFTGEDPNGTWTLTIVDDEGNDVGSLDSWSLSVASTTQNVVLGSRTDGYFTKSSFEIDRRDVVDGDGGSSGEDKFSVAGTLPSAGMVEDLSHAAFSVSVNGSLLEETFALDEKGKFASESGSIPKVKIALKQTGAYTASFDGIDLNPLLGLPNTTEEGVIAVAIEVSVVGSGLLLSRAVGTVVFEYKTTQDKSTKGKFAFKSNEMDTPVFLSTKTKATEIVGTGHTLSADGPITSDTGESITPNGDIVLQIGTAAPITLPFASLVITGKGAESTIELTEGSVPEIRAFSITNSKKAFSLDTEAIANTGLPIAGPGEALSHILPIRLTIPTASSTLEYATIVELTRTSETSTSWKP